MNTRRSGVIGLSALLGCAGISPADVVTFDVSEGDFHEPTNWNTGNMPTEEDRIVILDDQICNVVEDDGTFTFTIDTMNVQAGGVLFIDDGITLILENDDDNVSGPGLGPTYPDDTTINGVVSVGTAQSGGGTLFVKMLWPTIDEHVFGGDGVLVGTGSGNLILVQEDKVFTNLLGASGSGGIFNDFTFEASSGAGAIFNNEGRVIADHGAGILFEVDLLLTDVTDGVWGVDDCYSIMTFAESADLDGYIVHFGADEFGNDGGGNIELEAGVIVRTCGTYVIQNPCPAVGWIIGEDARFEYAKFGCSISPTTCSLCDNPCDPDCTGGNCDNTFSIEVGIAITCI